MRVDQQVLKGESSGAERSRPVERQGVLWPSLTWIPSLPVNFSSPLPPREASAGR